MTENPPPPPEEPQPPRGDFDPRRRSVFPPSPLPPTPNEPLGCGGIVALILLGIVSFIIALGLFISVLATGKPPIGLGVACAVLIALFVIRKKAGPSPALGAVVVGVGIAVVVFGGCMLILLSAKTNFK